MTPGIEHGGIVVKQTDLSMRTVPQSDVHLSMYYTTTRRGPSAMQWWGYKVLTGKHKRGPAKGRVRYAVACGPIS